MNGESMRHLEKLSRYIAVTVCAVSAVFATPLWLGARYPGWAKALFISCAVAAWVLPMAVTGRPQNIWALYSAVGLTAICMASLVFGLYVYIPALVSMLVAAAIASNAARRSEQDRRGGA
jgi:hypothetical protein